MGHIMTGNKYDLGCILVGATSSMFVTELFEKIVITAISMLIATTIAFFWRRYLHLKMRERMKNNKNKKNGSI